MGREERAEVTREALVHALHENSSAVAAARVLGIHQSHLYRLMKQHGITRADE
jgi:DNA-binding NtrC family response regulator